MVSPVAGVYNEGGIICTLAGREVFCTGTVSSVSGTEGEHDGKTEIRTVFSPDYIDLQSYLAGGRGGRRQVLFLSK